MPVEFKDVGGSQTRLGRVRPREPAGDVSDSSDGFGFERNGHVISIMKPSPSDIPRTVAALAYHN